MQATFGSERTEDGEGYEYEQEAISKRHSMTHEAVAAGREAGAYRTLLTHFSQRYPKIPVIDASFAASTCIASQWQIPDVASMSLMNRFYENMWKKGMGKLSALREAQLWLRCEGSTRPDLVRGEQTPNRAREEAAPGRLPSYYWAGFMLSGDWR